VTRKEIVGNAISEFAPIVTFVGVSETLGFEPALKALVVVSMLSLLLSWFIEKRIPKFGLIAASTIFLFGMLSIIFDNPFYIIIKDTLYEFIFGLALLIGLILGRSYLKTLFGDFFAISEHGWKLLTLRWMFFFFLLALSNEIVRRILTPETWVIYKFIAVFITWIFGFSQFTLVKRERLPESTPWGFRIRE
jgi:intracellular septation protein